MEDFNLSFLQPGFFCFLHPFFIPPAHLPVFDHRMQIRIGQERKAAEFVGHKIIRRARLFLSKQKQQLLHPDSFSSLPNTSNKESSIFLR